MRDVEEFELYVRERQWVMFEGFAREPKVKPPKEVSAKDVEQAEAEAKLRKDSKYRE